MSQYRITIHKKSAWCFISCLLILIPALFTSPLYSIGAGRYVFYIAAFVIAAYVEGLTLSHVQIRILVPWGLIFAVCLLNRNGDLINSEFSSVIDMLVIILFAVLFVSKDEIFMQNVLRALVVCLCVQLVAGFILMLFPNTLIDMGTSIMGLKRGTYSYNRFVRMVNSGSFMGLTTHYSTSGMYMALAVVLFGTYLFVYRQRTSKWNVKDIIVFLLFLIALILTQKRAHFVFGIVAILVMYFVGYVKGGIQRRFLQTLGVIVVVGVVFLIVLQIPAFQNTIARFFASDVLDETTSGRINNLWGPAISEFLQHPLLGMGWSQFKYQHPMVGGTVNNDVHNIYIQLLTENGVIIGGLIIAFFIFTYVVTWQLVKKYKYESSQNAYTFLMFSFGYQTFFLLYGLTGNPLYDIQCLFPYVICCCIAYRYRYNVKNSVPYVQEHEKIKAP